MDEKILKSEEKAIFALRSLYRKYGYSPYKMSKFEEYEYYIRNKDFLISDRIIAFNDTNGKMLALKPDVTLSIIKNGEDLPGCKQKVCYNENIYRISESTGQYKEIMQAGLECFGDIDLYRSGLSGRSEPGDAGGKLRTPDLSPGSAVRGAGQRLQRPRIPAERHSIYLRKERP